MSLDISVITDSVGSSYNFTMHLSNVDPAEDGLYAMTACVYQVNPHSCGYDAWTEVEVTKKDKEKIWNKYHLYVEIGVPAIVIGVSVVVVIIYCWRRSK